MYSVPVTEELAVTKHFTADGHRADVTFPGAVPHKSITPASFTVSKLRPPGTTCRCFTERRTRLPASAGSVTVRCQVLRANHLPPFFPGGVTTTPPTTGKENTWWTDLLVKPLFPKPDLTNRDI